MPGGREQPLVQVTGPQGVPHDLNMISCEIQTSSDIFTRAADLNTEKYRIREP